MNLLMLWVRVAASGLVPHRPSLPSPPFITKQNRETKIDCIKKKQLKNRNVSQEAGKTKRLIETHFKQSSLSQVFEAFGSAHTNLFLRRKLQNPSQSQDIVTRCWWSTVTVWRDQMAQVDSHYSIDVAGGANGLVGVSQNPAAGRHVPGVAQTAPH